MPKPKPKPKKSDPKQARPPTASTNPTPNWPPLRPLLPASDLHLVSLVHDQIYLIRNFLPASLCKTYTSFLSSVPLTTTPGKPKKDEAVRVNDRFQIEDERFAETLWCVTALRELVMERFDEEESSYRYGDEGQDEESRAHKRDETWGGHPLGLNPNIRIYRYSAGQFFAQHCMSNTHPISGGTTQKEAGYSHSPYRRRIQHTHLPPRLNHQTPPRPHHLDPPHLPNNLHRRRNGLLSRPDARESESGADSGSAGGGYGAAASAWRSVYAA